MGLRPKLNKLKNKPEQVSPKNAGRNVQTTLRKNVQRMFAYYTPIFNKNKDELSDKFVPWGQPLFSKQQVLAKLYDEIKTWNFKTLKPSKEVIHLLSIDDMVVLFQLIPNETQDPELISIIHYIVPVISNLLVKDEKHDHLYMQRALLFIKFANFILSRTINEIPTFFAPFVEKISGTEESKDFITDLILAEDRKNMTEQFWVIWHILYKPIINIQGYYSHNVIIEYMLAGQLCGDDIVEWHSLRKKDISFYENIAKDLGSNPAVLFSISKVLNSIASHFIENGIAWIHIITSNNMHMDLGELKPNTIFYLERLMRKFICEHREKIKKDIKQYNKVITILDFMIERGSVQGYLLRESIL